MNLKISSKSHKVFFILPWLLFVVSGVLSFDCLFAVTQFHGTSRNKRGRDVKELKLGMVAQTCDHNIWEAETGGSWMP